MANKLKHVKDWNFYEKIISLIFESFLTVIAIYSDIPKLLKNIMWVLIAAYFIYALIRLKKYMIPTLKIYFIKVMK